MYTKPPQRRLWFRRCHMAQIRPARPFPDGRA